MNNENKDFNKSELIKKLELLCHLEAQKPTNKMDTDLIEEAVALGLELKGINTTLTPEEVEEKVRKIPFVETTTLNTTQSVKGRTTKVKSKKILLIAAIISILVAILTVTSIAFEWNIFDELKNRFGTVADTPVNEEIDVNGISVYMHGETKNYKNLEDAIKNENLNILYPSKFPPDIVINQIILYEADSKDEIVFSFNNTNFVYSLTLNQTISDDIKNTATYTQRINNIEVYITEMTDIKTIQIHFEHNSNLYYLSYNNKQDLIETIENLKEFKNEN